MDERHDPSPEPAPLALVVMGVSGSGKSTVAALLAERLGWAFVDGDAFHGAESIARMRAGLPLGEADRAPWIDAMAAWIDARIARGEPGVIACSALRRAYRDALIRGRSAARLVYLEGSPELIGRRLAARRGHFMPATLLESQFATLEPPGPDERPITVTIDAAAETVAATIARRLGFAREA